jgi:DNA polymerase III epsilon subunit-like protein
MKDNFLLVFDTETTGLTLHPNAPLWKQPKIIEFGGIVLLNGEVEEEISFLINPEERLTEEIIKITGITDKDLEGQPTFEGRVKELKELFGRCAGVAAHNLPFDKEMILNDVRRLGLVAGFPWPAREMCTVGIYKEQWGRNPRLQELYADIMGKPLAQTHRALGDVKALVEIIQEEELWVLA